MTDQEFSTEAASLLARCSTEQRDRLAEMTKTFGKSDEGAVASAPRTSIALASDASLTGKSISEMFPDLKRLQG